MKNLRNLIVFAALWVGVVVIAADDETACADGCVSPAQATATVLEYQGKVAYWQREAVRCWELSTPKPPR